MAGRNTIYLLLSMLLAGCYTDYDSSLILDTYDPRVPQYSEIGANTAGAYINGEPWVCRKSTSYSIFSSNPYTRGTITFYLDDDSTGTFLEFYQGQILREQHNSNIYCSVRFFLRDRFITGEVELMQLDELRLELDGISDFGQAIFSNRPYHNEGFSKGTGILYIRNVEPQDTVHIISGTFGFSTSGENERTTVYSGRFDYQVSDDQFNVE